LLFDALLFLFHQILAAEAPLGRRHSAHLGIHHLHDVVVAHAVAWIRLEIPVSIGLSDRALFELLSLLSSARKQLFQQSMIHASINIKRYKTRMRTIFNNQSYDINLINFHF